MQIQTSVFIFINICTQVKISQIGNLNSYFVPAFTDEGITGSNRCVSCQHFESCCFSSTIHTKKAKTLENQIDIYGDKVGIWE